MESKEITSYFKYQRIGSGSIEGVKRVYWCENKFWENITENIKARSFVALKIKIKNSFSWFQSVKSHCLQGYTTSNPTKSQMNQE